MGLARPRLPDNFGCRGCVQMVPGREGVGVQPEKVPGRMMRWNLLGGWVGVCANRHGSEHHLGVSVRLAFL